MTTSTANFGPKTGIAAPKRRAVKITPSTAAKEIAKEPNSVFVCTFSTLTTLRREHEDLYAKLAAVISLVVVDECHYEPAVGWGRSVKELERKTVLLTATPYRNDLKLFQIHDPDNHCYHFTHAHALKANIVRDVSFTAILPQRSTPASASKEFANKWKGLKAARKLPSKDPRAIICCGNAQDIETVVRSLGREGLKAIGIHDRFSGRKETNLFSKVPKPENEDAEIWVHQHKLTEGLDDNRFCGLGLFTTFSNDRKLIQQIGRILRRDENDAAQTRSIVLTLSNDRSAEDWMAYREFEKDNTLRNASHFRNAVETLLRTQPEIEYFGGRFLRRFDPKAANVYTQVIVPPSALVRVKRKGFSIIKYIAHVTDTLNLEDAVVLGPNGDMPCHKDAISALWVYATIANSPSLLRRSLYQIQIETHCVVVSGNYLFVADSSGTLPTEYLDDYTLPVGATTLSKFLSAEFIPTNASTQSTIPYESTIRGMDIRGSNLSAVAPSITDRIHICRTARGHSESERRYVNMTKGRVRKEPSHEERRHHDLSSFKAWAGAAARILDSAKVNPSSFLERFMPACDPPKAVDPATISFDVYRSDLSFGIPGDDAQFICDNTSATVQAKEDKLDSYKFSLSFIPLTEGGEPDNNPEKWKIIEFHLKYKPEKTKFWITKDDASESILVVGASSGQADQSFAEYYNNNQDAFTVSIKGGQHIYSGQNFYAIDYSYFERHLLSLIDIPAGAKKCKNEKGTTNQIKLLKAGTGTTFPDQSLFREIAENRIGLNFTPDTIICDDLGSEAADFIAISFKSRSLAFIHAKASSSNAKISASAFHDVVAQASKNMVYLTPRPDTPDGAGSWTECTKWNNTNIPRLYLSPKGSPTGTDLWDKVVEEILDQPERNLFVILATCKCVSKSALSAAVSNASQRTPETAQLVHLLDGLNSQARQLGVKVEVKAVPHI